MNVDVNDNNNEGQSAVWDDGRMDGVSDEISLFHFLSISSRFIFNRKQVEKETYLKPCLLYKNANIIVVALCG